MAVPPVGGNSPVPAVAAVDYSALTGRHHRIAGFLQRTRELEATGLGLPTPAPASAPRLGTEAAAPAG